MRREAKAQTGRNDTGQQAGEQRRTWDRATRDVNAAVALEIVIRGYRLLVMQAHPDRGGDPERMKAINIAARWLRETITRMLPAA